jgi:Rrf2 family protein
MRVTLSRRGDYAVRAVFDLACRYPEQRKAGEIASAMGIPRTFLSQVLADLVRAGVLQAHAGPKGGYRLRRSPEEINLLEVVEAAEGVLELTECVLRGGPCSWNDHCAVHEFWTAAQEAFGSQLAATSLADFAKAAPPP